MFSLLISFVLVIDMVIIGWFVYFVFIVYVVLSSVKRLFVFFGMIVIFGICVFKFCIFWSFERILFFVGVFLKLWFDIII